MTILYIVRVRPSRSQKWAATTMCDTADEAAERAKMYLNEYIDSNSYVDIRIEKQAK
jgi:hypothetical protein